MDLVLAAKNPIYNCPYNSKCGKRIFSFFNFSFDLTTKYIGTKLIKQTNAINFNGISCTVFSVISAPGV